ncbi:MAG: ABC transporter ATP-binding protein, partial [Pirellulales bacterium]|nr:ABC transporter ATP-binding protein [Pirellulales bacterium]
VFGYIGPNGAGKTTSMRILATLDLPTAGDALIDGFSVVDDPDRVRGRLGFMPDYLVTYPNVNVQEYLDFFARAYSLRGRRRTEAVRRVMKFTGLDVLAEKPTTGLSKGMKQRLALGRAMIHDPAVLVLDEPAAGLDPRARIELRRMIRALASQGKTVLISSHILTELAEICDTVGIIEQGRLLAVGSVAEIQEEHRAEEEPTSLVEVRLLDDAAPLAAWLTDHESVDGLSCDGRLLRFMHAGDAAAQADLLRRIIEADFRVIAFGAKQKSLEDIFMKVTEGRVQ